MCLNDCKISGYANYYVICYAVLLVGNLSYFERYNNFLQLIK